ncbi:acetylcholinesterase [Caerostris extrusa]|uniref:Acetylcholinesterase n=1 Tax=Caerostris extrusa TaxID=172846 RepID=A0AAV4QXT8_CAEEX|nr:acetylcholinesterase [Caerostris extrusa]
MQVNPMHANIDTSQRIAKGAGCATDERNIETDTKNVIECLREKEAFELTNILLSFDPASDLDFLPQYEDDLFPEAPYEVIMKGEFHQVPLLVGDVRDEGVNMVTMHPEIFGFFGEKDTVFNKTFGRSQILGTVDGFLNCSGSDVASYYLDDIEDDDYFTIRQQTYAANGEITLTCPTSYFAESYAESGMDVYYYLYTHRSSVTPWAEWMGIVHFEEIQFVFGQPLLHPELYSKEEFQLSLRMLGTWAHFAKTGSPDLYHNWPKYSKENRTYMILDTDFSGKLDSGPSLRNCDFLRHCFLF